MVGITPGHWADGSPRTAPEGAGQSSSGVLNLPATVLLWACGHGPSVGWWLLLWAWEQPLFTSHQCLSVLLCGCADKLKL